MKKLQKMIGMMALYFVTTALLIFFGFAILFFSLYQYMALQVGPLAAGFLLAAAAFLFPIISLKFTRWYLNTSDRKSAAKASDQDQDAESGLLNGAAKSLITDYPFTSVWAAFISGWIVEEHPEIKDEAVKYALLYQNLTKEDT